MVNRWNPKTNLDADRTRPMYKSNSGKFVMYEDYKALEEDRNKLARELTAALIALGGIDGTTGTDRRSEAILSLDHGKREVSRRSGD